MIFSFQMTDHVDAAKYKKIKEEKLTINQDFESE
ncbi:hypothetical protein ALNOE001_01060 [Candidatus Methanobinarius endosymbioticus]|uniref:Uncharacterized protein n=1 Tax=Candidatus Methanobinarius endosymbioticus TaxID=2006182 RepID=A0A366MG21_9EURY|nr:hypothetical protein ALNOE001_01060 [Candidatus Methanobinarius endosymbioticus]